MFSILILTCNEAGNLPACLDAIAWCDDIWVLDSGSSDRTVEIARERGCHILTRPFDNFGNQRNYALDHADFKHDWVFDLDADERFTPDLKAECDEMVRKDEKSAYYCSYKNIMWDKWLKHSTCFPVYQMRFHKRGEIRFIPFGHGQKEGEAKRGIGYLKEPYLHYNFSKGLTEWFAKHVGYANREARLRLEEDLSGTRTFGGDARMKRRQALKRFSYWIPFRPSVYFIYLYVFRLGFLDGVAGFKYACMQKWFLTMTDMIYQDMKRARKIVVQ